MEMKKIIAADTPTPIKILSSGIVNAPSLSNFPAPPLSPFTPINNIELDNKDNNAAEARIKNMD